MDSTTFYTRLMGIKAFIFDMDGVLTDGFISLEKDGVMSRRFHTRDGSAMVRAVKKGFVFGIISAGYNQACEDRFRNMNVQHIYMNARPKLPYYKEILKLSNLKAEEVLYMGDDIADMQCIYASGIGVCPKDSCSDVLEIADYVCQNNGGQTAVREVIELVLKAQNKWDLPELINV